MKSSPAFAVCGLMVFCGCLDAADDPLSSTAQAVDDDDSGPFRQTGDGLVAIEAEHRHGAMPRGGKAWSDDAVADASGGSALKVGPNLGSLLELDDLFWSPRVDFRVRFKKTGRHYVWIRARAASTSDDSLHAGIDFLPLAPRVSGFGSSWTWSNTTMDGHRATIWVVHRGVHRVNLWMREDGLEVDKIIVTKDPSYTPTGAGPTESSRNDCDSSGHGHGHDDCDEEPPPVALCGNGVIETGEACDGGACCTIGCTFAPTTTVCRASAGACDQEEACSGASAECPADAAVAAGTECRASAGGCDVAEACDGSSTACPADGVVAAGVECRASAGACDVAEACDGSSTACPADGVVAAGVECRGSAGPCDVAEACDGSSSACPDNTYAAAGTECRGAAGVCDVGEACTGSSAACPVDRFVTAGTLCRGAAGDCDVAEACTGGDAACPDDGFVAAGVECRGSAGVCDVAEACTGGGAVCPADSFVAAGTECRGSAGACDAAEACTGGGADCPADAYAAAGTVCRGAVDTCDLAEVCDGSTISCPDDGHTNDAPVVSAGPDVEVAVTTGTATLAGTATDDGCPDAGFLASTWTAISGPGTVTFADATAAATTATFSVGGVYELELTATDQIQTASDRAIVTVNIAPTADAGPDRIVNAPDLHVTLFGSVSDDGVPTSSTLHASWSVVSGPAGTAFSPDDAQVTTASFTELGTYTLRLTADDGAMTATDDVTVQVVPAPDLAVDSVVPPPLDGNTLEVSGLASAAITNLGGATEHTFSVTFFDDRDGNGTLNAAADHVLGTGAHTGIGAGETVAIDAPVSGTVDFAGNLTYAFADSDGDLTETDETNNYGNSAPPCETAPPIAAFTPTLERSWTDGATVPASYEVETTPAIVDMNGDGVPDIVFTSHPSGSPTNANLRAIDGRTSAELFTTTGVSNALSGLSQIAVGDIDLDGHPEVIAASSSTQALLAFEHDGTFKWKVTLPSPALIWGGPAIADLDGDGVPEIVAARTVVNADGTIRWTGTAATGNYVDGPLTTVADLDLDGVPEVIVGRTAYRNNGAVYWTTTAVTTEGLPSVGNLDADANPEVVIASAGKITVVEHDGTLKWSASTSGLGGQGGSAVIADFDGDGAPEIGRSGTAKYGVWETDGTLKWTATIQDPNSGVTGSSAFDFDNDGAADVVFADEWGVRVFDGRTGAALFQQRLGSCTGYETPVVADIDADGRAELVAVANTSCAIAGNVLHGVFVFGNDAWIGSRRMWNQHTYHVTNVNDDGSIPAHEAPITSFRRNVASACPYALPDLTASYLRVTSAGSTLDLTVRIGNGGANPTPDSVPVTFYDGDPNAGGVELGTATTAVYIAPGAYADVTLTVPAASTTHTVWIVADDAGGGTSTIHESDEGNNAFDSGVSL